MTAAIAHDEEPPRRRAYGPGFIPTLGDQDVEWVETRVLVGECRCWHDWDVHGRMRCGEQGAYTIQPGPDPRPMSCTCPMHWDVGEPAELPTEPRFVIHKCPDGEVGVEYMDDDALDDPIIGAEAGRAVSAALSPEAAKRREREEKRRALELRLGDQWGNGWIVPADVVIADRWPTLARAERLARVGMVPLPMKRGGRASIGKWDTASEPITRARFAEGRDVGVLTTDSNLLVIDEDEPGELDRLTFDHGLDLPWTYELATPKGWHHWFRVDYAADVAGVLRNRNLREHGYAIDIRGRGSLVPTSGNLHHNGTDEYDDDPHGYVVDDDPGEIDYTPEPLPAAFIAWLAGLDPTAKIDNGERRFTAEQAERYVVAAIDRLQAAPGRNNALNDAAVVFGHFVPTFWPEADVSARLTTVGEEIGLETAEIGPTIASGLARGMAEPYALDDGTRTDEQHEQAVLRELATQRVRREALRRLNAEEAAPGEPVEALSLDDLLARTFDTPKYRIDGMWPSGGKVMVAGPRKAGKTTLVGNAIRCLLDGDDFLGRFKIDPMTPGHRVALLDFEMNAALVQEWLRDQKIKNTAGLDVFLMRGRGNWDIRDDAVRADWAARLRARDVDVLIVDPLGAVIHPLGIEENSNSEVGRFLTKLGELCEQAGIAELLVMHHAGHFAERSRGASKLLDWPDATWTIMRAEGDTLDSFIRAEGRDVELEETALIFDRTTRRLTLGKGNRQTVGGEHATALLEVLREKPGLTGNALETALQLKLGIGQPKAQKAIRGALDQQKIHRHSGKRRAQHHYVGMACLGDPSCPLADLGLNGGPANVIHLVPKDPKID